MGIGIAQNGSDLVSARDGFTIVSDGIAPPLDPVGFKRIGISRAVDHLWRWYVAGNEHISKR